MRQEDGGAAGPRITLTGEIGPEVIDVNGHMNVSGFDRIFDMAENELFISLGMGQEWILASGSSVFRLEKFVRYEREMLKGQPFELRSWLIGTDGRRIHHFHELWDREHDRRSAFFDCLAIHVSLVRRKSAIIEEVDLLQRITGLCAAQARHGLPAGVQPRGMGTTPSGAI